MHPLFYPPEPSGAFLQAAELCHPVWHVQPLLPRRTMWTMLQSLQQGTHDCVCITSFCVKDVVSHVGMKRADI